MTKKVVINCFVNGQPKPTNFFVGQPALDSHPIGHQAKYKSASDNCQVPGEVMNAIEDLYKVAQRNGANFEEICYYALNPDKKHSDKISKKS